LSNDDIVLERLPLPVTAADYERASARIDELLLATPGVVAVYKTGSVSAPGISDVDRIAVTSGAGRVESIWSRLTDRERYVAMHTPFIASSTTFAEHPWYAYVQPLELVAGEDVPLDPPTVDAALISMLLGIEGLVTLRLKLEKQAVTRRIKVRPLLCELNNLRHCLRLVGLDEQSAARAWELSRATTDVRRTWWDRAPDVREATAVELFVAAPVEIDAALGAILPADPDDSETRSLHLRGPWANVVLTAEKPARDSRRVPRSISRLSTRAAELIWRSRHRDLYVPAAIISALHSVRHGSGTFADRRARVARYQGFTGGAGSGWSHLGVAEVFAA